MDIREAEIELDAVLDTLIDGVVIINAKGTMRLFNPACVKIFGYATEDVLGKNVKMLMPEPFHGEHDGYLQSYHDTHKKKIIGIGREVMGRRKDGSVFPMDLAVGEADLDGVPLFVGIIRDLTARHEQQRKYEQLKDEHFHLSRVSAMNEMGSAIAHELNQPMAASINYLETVKLLLGRGGAVDKDKVLDIVSRAIEQTHRASDIIARMRGFIEKGDVEKSSCTLKDVIETAKRLAFLSFDNQDIDVKIEVPDTLPEVFVNSIQIQQVLVNLMKNACEAMVESPLRKLSVTAKKMPMEKQIEVQVGDTGNGLSEDDIQTLFVPFSSGKSNGMGVGLSISQSIISHHDGQIWAGQNDPVGSIFYFTLPISEEG
ncbi:MAG: PAS domain S-box protein [Litorimonas sp.]